MIKVDSSTKLLFGILLDHAGVKQICWPGYNRLMESTGFRSRQTLHDQLKKLHNLKYIQILKAPKGLGQVYITRYASTWTYNDLV